MPGPCSVRNQISIFVQTDRIIASQSEIQVINHQIPVCRNGRPFRYYILMRIIIVSDDDSGNIQRFLCRVCQFHPVRSSIRIIGLHFVKHHGIHDQVRLSFSGSLEIRQFSCPVRNSCIYSRCMSRPAVFSNSRAFAVINGYLVLIPQTE